MDQTSPNAPLPDLTEEELAILAELEDHIGEGVSQRLEDNTLPIIRLLQKGSPECDRRNTAYVEGASPGDWYFRDAPTEIVRGEVGFEFQPIFAQHMYVQWKPNRGGYSGKNYDFFDPPPEAAPRMDTNPETGELREVIGMPNGDYLEETFYFYGLVGKWVWVHTFRSTALTVARRFNRALQFREYKDKRLPIWGSTWRWLTEGQKNEKGEWYIPRFAIVSQVGGTPDGRVKAMPLLTFTAARELRQGVQQGLLAGTKAVGLIAQDEAQPAPRTLINDSVSNGAGEPRDVAGGAISNTTAKAIGDDIPF